ncbi:MAG: hypothetical protein KBG20_15190 [Caldilineaceae bacterium]|nr:hypothetical protein [Caldilineaceae bacterium]MBP8109293.1 hypothetical protein [Caldilineaceae bacterium]MBP8123596.1 hypothetical protein [Caldilineaceae bacterium]MBP9073650.1 hypothetical protein [Caldilineaceae bacterium]
MRRTSNLGLNLTKSESLRLFVFLGLGPWILFCAGTWIAVRLGWVDPPANAYFWVLVCVGATTVATGLAQGMADARSLLGRPATDDNRTRLWAEIRTDQSLLQSSLQQEMVRQQTTQTGYLADMAQGITYLRHSAESSSTNDIPSSPKRLEDAIVNPGEIYKKVEIDRFVGRDWLIEKINTFFDCYPNGYFVVVAKAGMGKTALLAWLAKSHDEYFHHFAIKGKDNTPDRCLENLTVQLTRRWLAKAYPENGPLPYGAGTTEIFQNILNKAASARDASEPHQKIVLLVDSLDANTHHPGQNPLGLPAELPDGVYIIATTRPPCLLLLSAHTPHAEVEIEAEGVQNRGDIDKYLFQATQRVEIARILKRSSLTPEAFRKELMAKAKDVWIYLYFVLTDLENSEKEYDRQDLEDDERPKLAFDRFPLGLENYYAEQFRQRIEEYDESALKSGEEISRRSLSQTVICAIAAVNRNLTANELRTWLGMKESNKQINKIIQDRWLPFVLMSKEDEPTYSLYHESIRDFMHGELTVFQSDVQSDNREFIRKLQGSTKDAHKQISRVLLDRWGGTKLTKLQQRKMDSVDDYGIENLFFHLQQTNSWQDIAQVLMAEWVITTTPALAQDKRAWGRRRSSSQYMSSTVVNAWYFLHNRLNKVPLYIEQLGKYRRLTSKLVDILLVDKKSTEAMVCNLRSDLLLATMASLNRKLWPGLISEMIRRGRWEVESGLALIRQIPDRTMRSSARRLLAIHLVATNDYDAAWSIAQTIEVDRERIYAYCQLLRSVQMQPEARDKIVSDVIRCLLNEEEDLRQISEEEDLKQISAVIKTLTPYISAATYESMEILSKKIRQPSLRIVAMTVLAENVIEMDSRTTEQAIGLSYQTDEPHIFPALLHLLEQGQELEKKQEIGQKEFHERIEEFYKKIVLAMLKNRRATTAAKILEDWVQKPLVKVSVIKATLRDFVQFAPELVLPVSQLGQKPEWQLEILLDTLSLPASVVSLPESVDERIVSAALALIHDLPHLGTQLVFLDRLIDHADGEEIMTSIETVIDTVAILNEPVKQIEILMTVHLHKLPNDLAKKLKSLLAQKSRLAVAAIAERVYDKVITYWPKNPWQDQQERMLIDPSGSSMGPISTVGSDSRVTQLSKMAEALAEQHLFAEAIESLLAILRISKGASSVLTNVLQKIWEDCCSKISPIVSTDLEANEANELAKRFADPLNQSYAYMILSMAVKNGRASEFLEKAQTHLLEELQKRNIDLPRLRRVVVAIALLMARLPEDEQDKSWMAVSRKIADLESDIKLVDPETEKLNLFLIASKYLGTDLRKRVILDAFKCAESIPRKLLRDDQLIDLIKLLSIEPSAYQGLLGRIHDLVQTLDEPSPTILEECIKLLLDASQLDYALDLLNWAIQGLEKGRLCPDSGQKHVIFILNVLRDVGSRMLSAETERHKRIADCMVSIDRCSPQVNQAQEFNDVLSILNDFSIEELMRRTTLISDDLVTGKILEKFLPILVHVGDFEGAKKIAEEISTDRNTITETDRDKAALSQYYLLIVNYIDGDRGNEKDSAIRASLNIAMTISQPDQQAVAVAKVARMLSPSDADQVLAYIKAFSKKTYNDMLAESKQAEKLERSWLGKIETATGEYLREAKDEAARQKAIKEKSRAILQSIEIRRAEIIVAMVHLCNAKQVHQIASNIKSMDSGIVKLRLTAVSARRFAQLGDWQEAYRLIGEISSPEWLVYGYAGIIEYLPDVEKHKKVDEIMTKLNTEKPSNPQFFQIWSDLFNREAVLVEILIFLAKDPATCNGGLLIDLANRFLTNKEYKARAYAEIARYQGNSQWALDRLREVENLANPQLLGELAHCWPQTERDNMILRSLESALRPSARDHLPMALQTLIPHLPSGQLSTAAEACLALPAQSRLDCIYDLATRTSQFSESVNLDMFHVVFSDKGAQMRSDFIINVGGMLPIIEKLSSPNATLRILEDIRKVQNWWP